MADLNRFAMSVAFVEAYGKLRPRQKQAARTAMTAIQRDPLLWNHDVRSLDGADEMQAIQIASDCWAVVQPSGAGLVMHWIGTPAAATEWARNHVCAVHPDTGSSQVYRRIDPAALDGGDARAGSHGGPLRTLTDRKLQRLGVPESQIDFVRPVLDDGEASSLEQLHLMVPPEAYESLFDLCLGVPYKKIVSRLDINRDAIASGRVLDGLDTAESKRQFAVGLSETEVERLLNEPLDTWRVFLHPAQRRPVERDWNGPVRVLGGAGTGKTVVAIHRSRWLARQALDSPDMFASGDKVLLLTYTRNLALELERCLRSVCSPEERLKVEVTNIDRWVWHFLAGRDVSDRNRLFGSHGLGYEPKLRRDGTLWRRAMAKRPGVVRSLAGILLGRMASRYTGPGNHGVGPRVSRCQETLSPSITPLAPELPEGRAKGAGHPAGGLHQKGDLSDLRDVLAGTLAE